MNNGILPLMGFPIADSNASTTPFTTQEVTLVAGNNITPGNVVTMRSDGRVYASTSSVVPPAFLNNDAVQPLTPLALNSSFFNGQFDNTNYQYINSDVVTDSATTIAGTDVFCVLFTGDNITPTTNLRLQTMRGNTLVAVTLINSFSGQDGARLLDLGNGNVLLLYWSTSVGRWVYEIRNAITHSTVLSATTLSNSPSSGSVSLRLSASLLSNGNAVIAYNDTGTLCYFRVISNTGNTVVAETSFSVSSNSTIATTAGGGWFAIGYDLSNQGTFRRYTNAGTLFGTAVSVGSGSGTAGSDGKANRGRLFMRSDGTLLYINEGSSPRTVVVYDTSNALVTTINLINTSVSMKLLRDDVFYVLMAGPSGAQDRFLFVIGPDNQLRVARQVISASALMTNGITTTSPVIDVNPDGTIWIVVNISDSGSLHQVNLLSFNSSGTQTSNTILRAPGNGLQTNFVLNLNCEGTQFIATSFGGASPQGMLGGWYFTPRQSIFGVARSAATVGGNVRVQVSGTATISPPFIGGVAFDRRTATPPGIRGVVGRSSAVLYGPI